MPAKVLTTSPLTTDEEVDRAIGLLPVLPDNVLVVVRHLQHQITALETRVADMEP